MPISTPTQITVPFATSGLKNAIPAASDPVKGNAGYDQGFTAINMTPRTAGGIAPFGQDFNGIFFDISSALQFLEAGGGFPYSSAFAAAVGGYPLGALVSRTDGSGLWRNTVANNTTDPEAFGAGWQPEDAGSTTVTMTNANVTLTALQAARATITISGTLTANVQLIFPAYQKQWLVVNAATGAFTVTCKTSAGGGVPIATSSNLSIFGDGTNIKRVFQAAGISKITSNGSFTVPSGVTTIYISGCGGGSGGGGGGGAINLTGTGGGGAGGGAGQPIIREPFSVTPGQVISITIGGGGAGGAGGSPSVAGAAGVAGGNTIIGSLITLTGAAAAPGGISFTTSGVIPGGGVSTGGFPSGSSGNDGASGFNGGVGDGGMGASGPFGGGGGRGRSNGDIGKASAGFGSGGGGAGGGYGTGAAGAVGGAGGSGSPGIVIIEW